MSDKKPGINPLLARYKSTVDYFYKGIPADNKKEFQENSITLKRKRDSEGDSAGSLEEKKTRLENDGGSVSVSRESSVDRSSVSSENIKKKNVSEDCHDGKEGELEKEENKLIITNKRGDSGGSADEKTFIEENDGVLRSVDIIKTNEELENKGGKLTNTSRKGDAAGYDDEKKSGEENDKSISFSRESIVDRSSGSSADLDKTSIMKICHAEKEGELEIEGDKLTSANNKRDSISPADKEGGSRSVSRESSISVSSVGNADIIMTKEELEKEVEKSTSAKKKESALKRKENYVKMTLTVEKFLETDSAIKKTGKVFICDVCRASFSSVEIESHLKLCPSVVIKRLTVPELTSWLSTSPQKTKVILERLKEDDIKSWLSTTHKVHDNGSSSPGQQWAKDTLLRPKSSFVQNIRDSRQRLGALQKTEDFCGAKVLLVDLQQDKESRPQKPEKQLYQAGCSLEQEKAKEREKISASDNKYVCGKCRMTFPDVKDLKLHLLNHLTGPEELNMFSETGKSDGPSAQTNSYRPKPRATQMSSSGSKNQQNSSGPKSPMIATGLKTKIISSGSQAQIISPGSQSQIVSSDPTILMNSSNPYILVDSFSPETSKNLASTKHIMNSSGSKAVITLLKNKTSVEQMTNCETILASVAMHMDTQKTTRINLQTNAFSQENNVKLPAEVAINNSWSTQETLSLPGIKQEADDSFGTHNGSMNWKPTWTSNNLLTSDSSRSADANQMRRTNQVLVHGKQFTNHNSHTSDLPPSTIRVTPQVKVHGGNNKNSDLYYFTNILMRDDHEVSGHGSLSKTTGTGSTSAVGSLVPNKNSLIVSPSLFNRGKTNSSSLKSVSNVQNSATTLPSPSPTVLALQALRDKFKNSHQAIMNQMSNKKTGPSQTPLSKKSRNTEQESRKRLSIPNADFTCSICSIKLRTADELRKHEVVHTLSNKLKDIVSRVQKTEEFVCGLCKMPFAREELLKIHIHCAHKSQNIAPNSSQEQVEEFVCGVCKHIFDADDDLKTHITTVHRIKIEDSEENEVFYCGLCNKSFQTASELENHMPVHTADKFVCGICNQPFIQSKQLIEHMASHAGTSAL